MKFIDDPQAYHRAYYRKRRSKIINHLGGKCVTCGSVDELQVDHVDPSKKSFNVSGNLTLESILDELAKCQLLCGSCHRTKTSQENSGFRHGTIYAWMKKKCDCHECSRAKREWNDARNEKRRHTPAIL